MKTYYCVTSSFDNHGLTAAAITSQIEAEEKPDDTSFSMRTKDVYNDWFDSLTEAKKFVADTLEA